MAERRWAWPVWRASFALGWRSFGGPLAHLGYFQRAYVQRLHWLEPQEYASLVALCQALPGPTSSQVGMLIGLHRAGWRGALAAWTGFTLPSALLMYGYWSMRAQLHGAFLPGVLLALQWLTVLVVAQAVWGMARRACPDAQQLAIAAAAALGYGLLRGVSAQALILAACALAGGMRKGSTAGRDSAREVPDTRLAWVLALAVAAMLLLLEMTPAAHAHTALGMARIFYQSGALVFGGGHLVLPLLHDALVGRGWIGEQEFLSAYGAAQLLPGPLFAISAYLGAACMPGGPAWLGALIAVTCIFLPGMLLAAAGRLLMSRLAHTRRARCAIEGMNAGAVGLLAAALYDPVLIGAFACSRACFNEVSLQSWGARGCAAVRRFIQFPWFAGPGLSRRNSCFYVKRTPNGFAPRYPRVPRSHARKYLAARPQPVRFSDHRSGGRGDRAAVVSIHAGEQLEYSRAQRLGSGACAA